jgi:putative cell wall-binding protein
MKIAARRRLAAGVVATTSALLAGVLIAPSSSAAPNLVITPNAAVNTETAKRLVFQGEDADFRFGGEAIFTRNGGGKTFTVAIDGEDAPTSADREGEATENFADEGSGLGADGPADAGQYNVEVTGDPNPVTGAAVGGTDTCTSCFTVLSPGTVSVSSVGPNSLRPNNQGNVSILGNNFERGSVVEVLLSDGTPDPAISGNNAPTTDNEDNGTLQAQGITTRTELKRRFKVAGAEPGARDVRVTNLNGNTAVCSGCFFVAGPPLTSVTPTNSDFNDPDQALTTLTFNGDNVTDGTPQLEFVGDPGSATRSELTVIGQNVRNRTATSVTADFDLQNAAPQGNGYQPQVVGSDGIVNACDLCRFTVIQHERQPTLTSLDRSEDTGVQKELKRGETATFAAVGTNFSRGATLEFTPAGGLTVTDVDFISPEQLDVTITAAADAATGDRDVTARLTDGQPSNVCDNCLVVTSAAASPTPSPSATPDDERFSFERFAGNDRYTTAARIATGSYASAETVLLANGQSDDPRTARDESHFPDALAAAYLAGNRKAPTLLATEQALPQPTKDALRTLQARNVVIIGGTGAISAGVEKELTDAGYTVTRIAGANRYDTAKQVAETPAVDYVGENPDGDRTAIVASGERFPDALVAGPLGYFSQFPILITASASLSEPTQQALENLGIKHVLIPGGTAAVSAQAEAEIRALGITTRRFAGQDRTQTATQVAAYAYDSLGFDRAHVELARGNDFPDALAGGSHAGLKRSPILLTATPNEVGAATESFLRDRGSQLREGDIFGGFAAVSQRAEDQAQTAAREGRASASPSPSASPSATCPPLTGCPSPTASPTESPSPTASPTESPSPTASPTESPSPTASPTP